MSGPTLENLLARVTDENRHPEIATGTPVGNEFGAVIGNPREAKGVKWRNARKLARDK